MKYKTHNDKEIDTNWSWYLGLVETSYDRLVSLFGEPTLGDEYKTDAVWEIEFEEGGEVATIYNYKTGINYLGDEGKALNEIEIWHIGGYQDKVVERILKIVNRK